MKQILKTVVSSLLCLLLLLPFFPNVSYGSGDSFGATYRELKQQLRQFSNNNDEDALVKAKELFTSLVNQSTTEDGEITSQIYHTFDKKNVEQIPMKILELAYDATKTALNKGNVEEAAQWFEIRESKVKFEKEATPGVKAMVELKQSPEQVEQLKEIIINDLKDTYLIKMKDALTKKNEVASDYFQIIKADLEKDYSAEDYQTLDEFMKNKDTLFIQEAATQNILQMLNSYEAQKLSAADVKAEAEKILKLINYINNNWSAAIKDGEIFNGIEYAELDSFMEESQQRFSQIKPALGEQGGEIEANLNKLQSLLANKDSKDNSQIVSQQILDAISTQTNVELKTANYQELNLQEIETQTVAMLDQAVQQYEAGNNKEAYDIIFESYFVFEPLEAKISSRDQKAVQEIESAFAKIKGNIQNGLPVTTDIQNLKDLISKSLIKINAAPSNWEMFLQSFIIILREGFEAILIIGALVAYMLKTGQNEQAKYIYFGSIAAVIASFIAAYLIRNVFKLSGANQEALEGITMLIAVAVLFYVSYWLISKVQGRKWQEYIKGKLQHTASKGNLYTMSFVAFLAVFREGFETILFYEALLAVGDDNKYIVYGFVIGCILLILLYLLIAKFSIRIPIKPFFAITSIFLYSMAFSFTGHGLFELQEGGYVSATYLSGWPTISLLGIYPTVESLCAQAILIIALLIAVCYFIYSSSKLSKRNGVLEQ